MNLEEERFTEHDTRTFYDHEDARYRSFWDEDGSLHWGYFDDSSDLLTTPADIFKRACAKWNEIMLARSGIDSSSKVLDLGCGNGTVSLWLADATGCEVVGIDLSGVRIHNAKMSLARQQNQRVQFIQGSILNLPFPRETFTHIWSQASLYHIPDRIRAIQETYRVLVDGGVLVFDDLVSPVRHVNAKAKRHVYDRLLLEVGLSHGEYVETLRRNRFYVSENMCLDGHLKRSYSALAELARARYPDLCSAYYMMCDAVDEGQIGWSFFACRKIGNLLSWVYGRDAEVSITDKYDHWASSYDSDLATPYRSCPHRAAELLADSLEPADPILDAGCGTGMVAERLSELGYVNIFGTDISPAMIRVAEGKGVYREVKLHDLHYEQLPYAAGGFAGVICVGVLTFNHVRPSAVRFLVQMLKTAGTIVLSIRQDFREQNPMFDTEIENLPLTLTYQERITIFESEPIYLMSFAKR